jgi:hypothetical protein
MNGFPNDLKTGLDDHLEPAVWPEFSIRSCGGVPTLHQGKEPRFCWGAERPIVGEHREIFQHLYDVGLRQFHVDATCSEDIYHPELRFWHGPGQFDGTFQDGYFRHILQGCPEAFLQLRIYLGAPLWWLEENPAEVQVYHDGAPIQGFQLADESSKSQSHLVKKRRKKTCSIRNTAIESRNTVPSFYA